MTTKKSTKRALLMSALALLMCFSMLIGSTYAWFTDSVTSGNNIIKSGNLDIELEYWNGTEWKDVKGASDILTNTLWEPGVTEVAYLRVANAGSLAFKYQLGINILNEVEGTNQAGESFKLSDYIMFGVVEDVNGETEAYPKTDAGRAEAIADVAVAKRINNGYSKASSMESGEELYLALVVYMPTTVDNVANHDGKNIPQINLGINVYATQYAYENDSFGNDYDDAASVTVEPGESIADAIKNVEDGGVVFLANGVHDVASGPIVIEGKKVAIVGLGEVTINKNYGNTHIFTVKNGADVTIENVTMDGKGNTREGVYVRWNSKVTLKDVVIKNTGGLDIMIDEASDAAHGEETASYVWLYNSHIEDVAMCASPVTTVAATQDTFVYFNYDAASTVGAIDVQSINTKPENIIINGVKSTEVGKTMQLYVSNDAELTAALNTIKTNSDYWNKNVIVYLAAGEYSADHVINQYPLWNGIVGRNNGNNYQGGVPAGDPVTNVTFVGETASSYSLRGAQTVPVATFTGCVTVNGFGDAQTGFGTAVARTTFENIAFANSTKANADDNIAAVEMTAAAANVTFTGCTFQNAEYIIVGARAYNIVGDITFDGCTFSDVCISGYVDKTITVKNSVVIDADGGFINNQNNGDIVVDNCTINAGRYFVRTNGINIDISVSNSDITMYESEGTKHLVYFRGSNESAEFVDCTIADGYTTEGVDANSTLEIYNFSETEDGLTLVTDGITDEVTLYLVPADYEGTTVTVPEGVDAIGNYAFAYNSNIETIVLSSTVTTLNDRAFRDTSASTVVLNEGLTNISYQAFRNALNVKSVEIPSTVTTISKEAFQNSGITTLTIPATVKTIEYGGCRDMKMLENVVIEGNVEIPVYAFRACTELKSVTLKGTNVTFSGKGMIFTNKENGDGSAITVTVANEEIKARLLAADTAAKDYGGYTIICEQTTATDENGESLGYYVDEQGTTATTYDANGLIAALKDESVETVVLADDVTVAKSDAGSNAYGATGVNVLNGQTFDGNGNDFGVNAWGTWDSAISITGGTIKNVTINEGMRGIFVNHNSTESSKVYLENVTIDGTIYTISCDQGTNQGLEATNSTFNGWTSYAATIGDVLFTNCSFGEGQGYAFCRPYAPTTFVGCDFEAGYEIDARAAVVFENCTIDGLPLTAENLATLVTSNIANATVIG